MKLFVTRHGETAWNAARLISGISDVPLTENGVIQAQALANMLAAHQDEYHIKHIVVSHLQRARVTASYIEKSLGLTAVVDARLHEVNFGSFEKTSTRDEAFLKNKANPFKRFEGGESILHVAHRVYAAIEDVKKTYAPDNVLFVCHGMVSAVISTYFRDYETVDDFVNVHIENCGLQIYEMQ